MRLSTLLLLPVFLSQLAKADSNAEKVMLVCHLPGGAGEECRFASNDQLGFCLKSLALIDLDEKLGTAALRAEIYDKNPVKTRFIHLGSRKFDFTGNKIKGRWASNQATFILNLAKGAAKKINGTALVILDGTPIKPTSQPTIFKNVECQSAEGANG